jgi:hypothetical protein
MPILKLELTIEIKGRKVKREDAELLREKLSEKLKLNHEGDEVKIEKISERSIKISIIASSGRYNLNTLKIRHVAEVFLGEIGTISQKIIGCEVPT